MTDGVTPSRVERLFLTGQSIADICCALNASTDVVEDALRDRLQDWKHLAKNNARKLTKFRKDEHHG